MFCCIYFWEMRTPEGKPDRHLFNPQLWYVRTFGLILLTEIHISLPDLTVESCTIRFTSFCMLSKRRMSYPTGMKCSYRCSTLGFLSSAIWIFDFHSKFSHKFLWEGLERSLHKKNFIR